VLLNLEVVPHPLPESQPNQGYSNRISSDWFWVKTAFC